MVKQKLALRPSNKTQYSWTSPGPPVHFHPIILNSCVGWHCIFTVVSLAKKNAYSRNCFCSLLKVKVFLKNFPKEIFNCESLSVFIIPWMWTLFENTLNLTYYWHVKYIWENTQIIVQLMLFFFFSENDHFFVELAPRWGNKPLFVPRKLSFPSCLPLIISITTILILFSLV